jgi:flagellar biogenesis protein FliO
MAYARRLFRLRKGSRSKGQAVFEYVLLLGFFVVVIFVFMKFGSALAKGFKSVSVHVARMAP